MEGNRILITGNSQDAAIESLIDTKTPEGRMFARLVAAGVTKTIREWRDAELMPYVERQDFDGMTEAYNVILSVWVSFVVSETVAVFGQVAGASPDLGKKIADFVGDTAKKEIPSLLAEYERVNSEARKNA